MDEQKQNIDKDAGEDTLHSDIARLSAELAKDARIRRQNHYINLIKTNRIEILVVLNGIIVTFLLFAFLNNFTTEIATDKHTQFGQKTVTKLSQGISELEETTNILSSMIHLAQSDESRYLKTKTASTIQNIKNFNEVIWVYRNDNKQWVFDILYRKSESQSVNGEVYQSLVNKVLKEKPLERETVSISHDILQTENFHLRDEKEVLYGNPLVLYRAIDVQDKNKGFVIATSNIRAILAENWYENTKYVSSLRVTEAQSNKNIYTYMRENVAADDMPEARQEFIIQAGQNQWKLHIEFFEDRAYFWLDQIPLLVIVFGSLFIAITIYYVRAQKSKEGEIEQIRRTFESKNYELEIEIAERERLNHSLRRAERENRAIIDAVSDIIFETDTDGKIRFLSLAWEKVTGFEISRAIGQNFFEMLHPEEQMEQVKDFNMLIKGHKQPYRTLTRIRTSEGTFRAVELAFSMIRQDENKDLRVVGMLTDIEERRRAENALNEAEKKYKTIVENAAGGIYQMTPEGLYLSANPAMARILGYDKPEDIISGVKNANESIYVDKQARMKFIHNLVNMGVINNYEVEVYKKDGSTIWVNENVRCVLDDSGSILYHEGSMEDISKRKKSEIAMVQAKVESDMANRAKNEFLANMSHELRTPLNSIIGFAEMIKDEVLGAIQPPEYRDYAVDIYESGQGLLKIINEILDISRIEAKERELNEALINLEALCQSCLELVAGRFHAKKLNLSVHLKGMPKVIAEEHAMKQIFMNLLSNAIKFTPESGRITISYEVSQNGELRLTVTDTGVGLTEDEIEKALTPFGQIDNAHNRSGSGTGLGLTLVDLMTKLHAGRFELFSQKGIGTSATIILPVDRVVMKSDEDLDAESISADNVEADNATKH